jgi:hypothetical protein
MLDLTALTGEFAARAIFARLEGESALARAIVVSN